MSSGPPFDNGIDHVDLTEAHRLEDQIKLGYHPLSTADLEELIDGFLDITNQNGTKRSLTQLFSHAYQTTYIRHKQTEEQATLIRRGRIPDEEDPGLPPRLVEYGVGLVLQRESQTTQPASFVELAEYLFAVPNWFSRVHTSASPPRTSARWGKYKASHSLLFGQLTTRRFLDGRQFLEKAYRTYKPFEDQMLDRLGFTIEDAIYYHNFISDLVIERGERAATEQLRHTDSILDIDEEMLRIAEEQLWVEKETLVEYCDDTERFHNFLDRLSTSPGDVQELRYPWDINPLRIHPIINYERKYLLPFPRTLQFALAHTFYYDLIATETGGEFGDTLGTYLEDWAGECLEKIFDSDNVYRNVTYDTDGVKTESDIVVIHNSTLIVFECKSKKLTAKTRRGEFGGINAIEEDLRQSIGKGYTQADRLIRGIQQGTVTSLQAPDGGTIAVSDEKLDTYIRCIVLGESFDAIATRDFGRFLNVEALPYVLDIFDLQVITHILDDPEIFIRYVEGRIDQTTRQVNQRQYYLPANIHSPDEIDYMAFYKRQGMEFRSVLKDIVGMGDALREQAVGEMIEAGEMRFYYES
jgi:hypothetical protein